jgi:hypothetical protein
MTGIAGMSPSNLRGVETTNLEFEALPAIEMEVLHE